MVESQRKFFTLDCLKQSQGLNYCFARCKLQSDFGKLPKKYEVYNFAGANYFIGSDIIRF